MLMIVLAVVKPSGPYSDGGGAYTVAINIETARDVITPAPPPMTKPDAPARYPATSPGRTAIKALKICPMK
jgi:hypothetical protein